MVPMPHSGGRLSRSLRFEPRLVDQNQAADAGQRDLALFNLAIDSKLRGCDVVAIRVDELAPCGYAMDRDDPAEEDRRTRPIRADRSDTNGDRRVP
jgi:hypothetical protein